MRFPEFSGEWENLSLNDIVLEKKKRVSSSTLTTSTYISTENMLQNFAGVSKANGVPSNNVVEYKIGDILISNIRPYLKKIWLANQNGGCSSDIIVLSPCENYDGSFVYYLLANDGFVSYVMSGAKGLKMPRGDKQQILKYGISIPSLKEQRKIAALLDLFDQHIETQKKIIEKYESLIRGLCEKLTRQGTPNKIIAECLKCHSTSLQESAVLDAGSYPVYGAIGICGYTDTPDVSGDGILIIKDGASVGVTYFADGTYSFIGTLNRLTANEDINLRYVYYCLKVLNFTPYKTGLAIPHIYFKDYGKHKIWCPTLEQQSKIADALTTIENKIQVEKSLLAHLNSQKQYMLNQLFI